MKSKKSKKNHQSCRNSVSELLFKKSMMKFMCIPTEKDKSKVGPAKSLKSTDKYDFMFKKKSFQYKKYL